MVSFDEDKVNPLPSQPLNNKLLHFFFTCTRHFYMQPQWHRQFLDNRGWSGQDKHRGTFRIRKRSAASPAGLFSRVLYHPCAVVRSTIMRYHPYRQPPLLCVSESDNRWASWINTIFILSHHKPEQTSRKKPRRTLQFLVTRRNHNIPTSLLWNTR